ncbi:MAG: hypothetical protein EZS28_051271 [Streblomastix strix]|uniref:Uncharacterized protein n=1 Tax=Streblomastix strix TaxID=222440 RepID=A0A5J4T5Y7_9EUKA|nr:MAG: hypothetical protein EZS28_051271 [Streblomastix strix]
MLAGNAMAQSFGGNKSSGIVPSTYDNSLNPLDKKNRLNTHTLHVPSSTTWNELCMELSKLNLGSIVIELYLFVMEPVSTSSASFDYD